MLELQDGSVNLVNEDNRLNLFLAGLSEDCFSLDADTFDTINNNESTIGDS